MRSSIYRLATVVILLVIAIVAWKIIKPNVKAPEVILFASIGSAPLQDYIFTIYPSGQHLEQFLAPKFDRSYIFASGTALRENFIVQVHEILSQLGGSNILYIFRPISNEWSKLTTEDYNVGEYMTSSDGSQVVFNFSPPVKPLTQSTLPRLAIMDIKSGKIRKMNGEEGTWDSNPAWLPNEKEVMFIRSQRAKMGVKNKLMHASLEDLNVTTFLDEPTGGFCISPTGTHIATISKEGIEIITLSDMTRTVILPMSKLLPNYGFKGGGMCWSRYEKKIAIAVYNVKEKRHEIWILDIERKTAKSIYKSTAGSIQISSFINNT